MDCLGHMNIERLVGEDAQIAGVLCLQFGDSGKGKISDLLMRTWGDVNARGTGGANAGHTVYVKGKRRVFHLLPVGITYDREGKITMLGQGMVIDPFELWKEMNDVTASGGSYTNLQISQDAHVVMPYHLEMDKGNKTQTNGGIGSTGRGIGPAYADKIARFGVTMRDLTDKDTLVRRLRHIKEASPERNIDVDQITTSMYEVARHLAPFMRDTSSELRKLLERGKKVVLEGAQGTLLSVEHGTYPYVTSSDCTLNGTASGVGLSARKVDSVLGICKFPFMSRVGGGPFPTEFGGAESAAYCAREVNGKAAHTRECEAAHYAGRVDELLNSSDPFLKGIGVRMAADEYGATTGRPRRVGWVDAFSARYATWINSVDKLVLTKVDALEGINSIQICTAYENASGLPLDFPRSPAELACAQPVYGMKYPGPFACRGIRDYSNLPEGLRTAIEHFRWCVGAPVGAISTGPEAEDTIVL